MVDVNNSTVENGNGKVEVELEAMRKGDFSWHPCKVSLSSSGVGILVEYSDDNSDPDNIILSTEEAVARLRIRSTPLEGLSCSRVQQGDYVLAKRSHVNLLFDAEVTKVARVRHSNKTHCRCTFTVKWIHNGLEGETAIIPSSALMRVSTESIHAHPTIFSFFNTLSASSCCDVSPLRVVTEGMDSEMDDSELEKKIEQIRNSANISVIKITKEILFEKVGVSNDLKKFNVLSIKSKQIPDNGQEHSKFNQIGASEFCNLYIHLPQSNLPIQTEIKHSPPLPPPPFIAEAFPDSRSPCNPRAACAALASLMSKSSDVAEILSVHRDIKGRERPPNTSKCPVPMKLLNGSIPHDVCLTNNSSKSNSESYLGIEIATAGFAQNCESIVKELFPTVKKPIKEPQTLDASGEVSKWEGKNEKSCEEVASGAGKHVSSTRKKKTGLPTTVVKRSSCDNVQPPLTNTRRLTRSMARETKEKQTVEMEDVTKDVQSITTEVKLSQDSDLLANKERTTSISSNKSSSIISDKKFNNQMDKRDTRENNVFGVGIQDLNSSGRLTRSVVKGQTKKDNEEPYSGLEHISKSDMDKGNFSSPEDEISPNPSAKGYTRLSPAGKTTQTPEDDTTRKVARSKGLKRKSITSKKQELRSSPRLRFLPRTRSQTKS